MYYTAGDPEMTSKKDNDGHYIKLPKNKKNQVGALDISNDEAVQLCIQDGYIAFQRTSPNVNYPNGRIYLKAPYETFTDNEVIRKMQEEENNGESCRKARCYFVGKR